MVRTIVRAAAPRRGVTAIGEAAALRFVEIGQQTYAQFERLAQTAGLVHAFACRPLDVSARDEALPHRAANRRRMLTDWRLDPDRLHYCVQAHQTRAVTIHAGQPAGPQPGTDLILTAAPGEALMTFSADCPLVLAYDPHARVLGLAHASWRCTVAQITPRLITLMRESGANPADIRAGIGPSAGPCCYEVREDVLAAAATLTGRDAFFPRRDGRMFFDLWAANRAALSAAGVPAENIEQAGLCTLCRNDLFFSFRREGAGCGHFGLLAAMTSI